MATFSSFLHFCVKRFRATVINDIWFNVLLFAGVATAVYVLTVRKIADLGISNQMLTVLGTVLGLVVSFRTSSAYERYQDGRKLWTNLQLTSRNLAILIWVQVPTERALKAGQQEDPTHNRVLEAIVEKKSMINLVQAFSVSVKHFLRGEAGVYYQDLYPLISFLPRYAHHKGVPDTENLPVWADHGKSRQGSVTPTGSASSSTVNSATGSHHHHRKESTYDPEKALPEVTGGCEYELMPARSPPEDTAYDYFPPLLIFKPIVSLLTVLFLGRRSRADKHLTITGKRRKAELVSSNVPLEISLFLSSYFNSLMGKALLAPAVASMFLAQLGTLQDSVANLERVRSTPIPFAYQAHLRMCMWLYLFFLPFQIVAAYGFLVIPATAFAAFLLLGFLEIGQEIEDPFGYDLNDLAVDDFCLAIARELHEITAHPAPDPATYVYSASNQPFAPSDRRAATEILSDIQHEYHMPEIGQGSVHRTLLKNWREVNAFTRK